jgi:hypothetical protein
MCPSPFLQLDSITERRNDARKAYEALRKARLDEFMTGFGVITLKLKEMYQMITLGGDAELELVDSLVCLNNMNDLLSPCSIITHLQIMSSLTSTHDTSHTIGSLQ